ncbi:MAG TPA: hypothetical protein PLQ11_07940, partial [Beijerinckiaceae bacterium]|nr:hypothetical protein [Beijerinckiaceae bacterium]
GRSYHLTIAWTRGILAQGKGVFTQQTVWFARGKVKAVGQNHRASCGEMKMGRNPTAFACRYRSISASQSRLLASPF